MIHLEKIEREIKAMGPQDLARFRAWFAEYDAANWDAKIEADAAGKLDTFANTALAAHRAGRTRDLTRSSLLPQGEKEGRQPQSTPPVPHATMSCR